jgi:GT2 family glycosyltransferase
MIEIVSATRLPEPEFWENSALGCSLRRLEYDTRLVPRIAFENRRGLPEIYNARIVATDHCDFLVFVHDDVWLDDFFLADHVLQGCSQYDVIGIAGNRRRIDNQPGWFFIDERYTWDDRSNLSGAVGHGKEPFSEVAYLGPSPADCELLDGVFMAARKSVLVEREVRFDPQFDFHFYDMDFCRSARAKDLRIGTWPICLTHQSTGAFGGDAWNSRRALYLKKWKS